MKYILLSLFSLLIILGLIILIVFLINKVKKLKWWINTIGVFLLTIIISISSALIYFAINYNATENAKSYLKSDELIEVIDDKSYIKFDNIEYNESAILFYGGAKVEEASYAQLCNQIAHEGIDVFLVKFPLYFPLININAADKIVSTNDYKNLYLMGHSLGGTCCSLYLTNTQYSYKGIIFLASYSKQKLNDSLKCLSIYGSCDTVLDKDEYNRNIVNFPKDYKEVIIDGGNHSNFGDYGFQKGDEASSISKDKQIEITISEIVSFII